MTRNITLPARKAKAMPERASSATDAASATQHNIYSRGRPEAPLTGFDPTIFTPAFFAILRRVWRHGR